MSDLSKALQIVGELPKFYLGQQVKTEHGTGIIVKLEMHANGLYIEPQRARCVVWFSTKKAKPWVQYEFKLSEIKPIIKQGVIT